MTYNLIPKKDCIYLVNDCEYYIPVQDKFNQSIRYRIIAYTSGKQALTISANGKGNSLDLFILLKSIINISLI